MKTNLKNLHRDFIVRDLVVLLPQSMADTTLRFYENDRVNSSTKAELMKVADFDTRKACHMAMVEEKRPSRARPAVNDGLCYKQTMLKEKSRNKRTNFRQNKGNGKRGKGKGKGRGKSHGKGFKKVSNNVDSEGKQLCNKCKKPGHFARDCPQKRTEGSAKK